MHFTSYDCLKRRFNQIIKSKMFHVSFNHGLLRYFFLKNKFARILIARLLESYII